jgi:hypothetical protein
VSLFQGKVKYPVSAVNVLKAHGGRAKDSVFVDGYALNCTVSSQMMVKRVENAKIACLDFNLMKTKMKLGVQILVSDPEKLEAIRAREADITKVGASPRAPSDVRATCLRHHSHARTNERTNARTHGPTHARSDRHFFSPTRVRGFCSLSFTHKHTHSRSSFLCIT